MTHVLLGVGSNRQRQYHLTEGLIALHQEFATADNPLYVSRVFESAAVGFDGAPFYNLVVGFTTAASVEFIQQRCKALEIRFGHQPGVAKYSPRTLDIDILLYDQMVMEHPVQLPRAEILHNAFVLWPLAELVPNFIHPLEQRTLQSLWDEYESSQQLEPIEFSFPQLPYLQQGRML